MKLCGLILSGGESRRMGEDKGQLRLQSGQTWIDHALSIVSPVVETTFISVRAGHSHALALYDEHENIGPAAGLLAAHHKFPDRAWLVFAVDFPLATSESIQHLFDTWKTDSSRAACYIRDERPEPLFAVWPPETLKLLETNVARGLSGPIATLKEVGFTPVRAQHSSWIENVNTPEQRLKIPSQS